MNTIKHEFRDFILLVTKDEDGYHTFFPKLNGYEAVHDCFKYNKKNFSILSVIEYKDVTFINLYIKKLVIGYEKIKRGKA